MKINIFKIQNDKEDILRSWGSDVMKNKEEALASLIEENCLAESMKMFTVNGEIYVVGVMCPEKGKQLLPYNTNRPINKEHMSILKDVLGEPVMLEDVYTFVVD